MSGHLTNVFEFSLIGSIYSWDASEEAKYLIISLLKAANRINGLFKGKVIVTIFLRSDIYDGLYFEDQDKLRQNEEILRWDNEDLKASSK